MLLPSDIARLILGYLQEEGLYDTSRAFIHESPNLKEYAEHSSEDGTIPACVFSIFGKGLTTILNEYVAVKTKESNHQVPPMISSLWKKLDFTLNQIKSLQNSPALAACQRMRTRVGMANIARQRALSNPSAGVVCTTVSESFSIVSPAQTSHCILTHSTPVSNSGSHRPTPSSAPLLQSFDSNRLQATPKGSPVHVSDPRLNPAPMSPGRRKWKRAGASGVSTGSSRPVSVGGTSLEEETEETVDEHFPQLVIQNARERILGDRSLQEKLAENINKILSSDPTPQSSKAASHIVEPDQSIDEILGLQGEIHMSDDAIHDILEQTESDPAFQALFDLFECNKTRSTDVETADGVMSSLSEEVDGGAGPASLAKTSEIDTGVIQKDISDTVSVKAKAVINRQSRKSVPVLKKSTIIPLNRNSKIENSSARLLVMHSSQEVQGRWKPTDKNPYSDSITPMDIGETQAAVAQSSRNVSTLVTSASGLVSSHSDVTSLPPITSMVSDMSNLIRQEGHKVAEQFPVPLVPTLTLNQKYSSPSQHLVPSFSPSSQQMSNCAGETHISLSSERSESSTTSPSAVTSTMSPSTYCVAPTSSTSPVSVSSSASVMTPPSSTLAASTTGLNASNKAAADPNNVMSLKIIISENQEDAAASPALNNGVSNFPADKVPTIYLSSPVKSIPGTPKSGLDETAQAVSCLQRSESVIASPLTGTSHPQQSYFIQLPFEGATTATASYFIVTEPPPADGQNRPKILPAPVSKGQAIAPAQFGVTPQSQGFTTGSALILPSPMKPMMLPLSVMGQNAMGNVQMVPNQLVAIPSSPMIQKNNVQPSPGFADLSTISSSDVSAVSSQGPPHSTPACPNTGHRRILCFDSSGVPQTSQSQAASSSQSLPPKSAPTKPKRRIQTVRCSASTAPQQNRKEVAKKGSRKQEFNVSTVDGNIIGLTKTTESRRKSSERKQNHDTEEGKNKEKDSRKSRSLSSDSSQKPVSRNEKEASDKSKTREVRTEKRTQENANVMANKENELKGSVPEQVTASSSSSSSSSSAPAPSNPQTKASKPPSKASLLAKQAAEMLQDIQAISSPKDLSSQEESGSDCIKTPTRTRKARDAEGTPRHLMPASASDLPTCSPASEAGSESSINMAAHTLMILSRAALARTGTPLKNSLRQEGSGEQSPTTTKVSKKRKQTSLASSPPAKKEAKRTPSKKKERKKLVECFPQDLDVDKFLSSLHYDE